MIRESDRKVKLQRSVEQVPNQIYKETEEEEKERQETPLRMLWKRHGKILKARRKDSYDPYKSPPLPQEVNQKSVDTTFESQNETTEVGPGEPAEELNYSQVREEPTIEPNEDEIVEFE